MLRIATLITLVVAGAALAQYEITIDVENPVLRPGESTLVTMYAGFDRRDYAMAAVQTQLVATMGSIGLSDATLVRPMNGAGTRLGMAAPTGWVDIKAGQLHFLADIIGDPTNPIAFWQVTYTAPAEVVVPFSNDLSTISTQYDVYILRDSPRSETHLAELAEGSATIHVIPAPASALVLALGVFVTRRRR